MEIVTIASKNQHKVAEFQELLAPWKIHVRALPLQASDSPENGSSFESNALEKAVYYSQFVDGFVLADDSGLSVDALSGRPGIHSARYAGHHGDDAANRRKLLEELDGVREGDRTAFFTCALALFHREQGFGLVVRTDVQGVITTEEVGQGGFGYDPLFFLPNIGKTYAELSAAEKNRSSHRAKAVVALLERWKGEGGNASLCGE